MTKKSDEAVVAEQATDNLFDEARELLAELNADKHVLSAERLRKEQRIQTMLLFAIAYELRRFNNNG